MIAPTQVRGGAASAEIRLMNFPAGHDTIRAMKSFERALFSLLLVCPAVFFAAGARAQKPPAQDLFVITNVNVVDVRNGNILAAQTVILNKNRIYSIEPDKTAKYPRNANSINGRGYFLIPGLWDMHVHLVFGDWFPDAAEITLPLLIANGVTGVRDMGSELQDVQNLRNEIEAGRMIGPRIYTAGPMLDGPKPRFPSSIAVATPEDGRKAVDDLKARGVDFIKLQSLIPREAVFAIADEAKKQEIAFEGHVPDSVRASEMAEHGMKSFEHLIGIFEGSSPNEDDYLRGGKGDGKFLASYDPQRAAALAALLAKKQIWQCPTLVWEHGGSLLDVTDFAKDTRAKYVPASWKDKTWKRFTDEITQGYASDDLATRKKFVEKELEVVNLLHKAGVPFLAGTDTPPGVYIFPGYSLHEELQRFVAAGFTPLEALQTATWNPAQFWGIEEQFGTVEKGKMADLVLLGANPLQDISNTQKIAAVFVNGQFYSGKDLDRMLAGVETAARRGN
jgi:imidazolonepropionase-like amidohydrolase